MKTPSLNKESVAKFLNILGETLPRFHLSDDHFAEILGVDSDFLEQESGLDRLPPVIERCKGLVLQLTGLAPQFAILDHRHELHRQWLVIRPKASERIAERVYYHDAIETGPRLLQEIWPHIVNQVETRCRDKEEARAYLRNSPHGQLSLRGQAQLTVSHKIDNCLREMSVLRSISCRLEARAEESPDQVRPGELQLALDKITALLQADSVKSTNNSVA